MIDEISEQVNQNTYKDDKSEITQNMEMLKVLVDELYQISDLLTPKDSNMTELLGKSRCKTALNYIRNNSGEDIYNDHLYDDYTKVNNAYNTYITYKTALFSDNFDEHKQSFINELATLKKNLVEKVYSTFEYGETEYCQTKPTNTDNELIKSVEKANKRAETVLAKDDSVINRDSTNNTNNNKFVRSSSVPNIPIQTKSTYNAKQYKDIARDINWNITQSEQFQGKGKDIFIQKVGNDIHKLLQNPDIKDRKELRDIQFHLSNYLQRRDSTPEQIGRYMSRVKSHINKIYGGRNTRKNKSTKRATRKSNNKHVNRRTKKGKYT